MKATKNYMGWKMTNKFQYFDMASRMEKDFEMKLKFKGHKVTLSDSILCSWGK